MWYRWTDLGSFDSWHNAVCVALGFPMPGRNAATGEVDENAQWTTDYVTSTVCADDDVRAYVEQHVADLAPDGLGVPVGPPPAPAAISGPPVPMPDDGGMYAWDEDAQAWTAIDL